MAGTYGQSGVTYGETGGSYGDWGDSSVGVESHTGGETDRPPREIDNRFATQYGYLRWRVVLSGEGVVEHESELLYQPALQPVGADALLTLRLSQSSRVEAVGNIGYLLDAGDAELTAFGVRLFSSDLELRAISDPPALLSMLGLPAEVPLVAR